MTDGKLFDGEPYIAGLPAETFKARIQDYFGEGAMEPLIRLSGLISGNTQRRQRMSQQSSQAVKTGETDGLVSFTVKVPHDGLLNEAWDMKCLGDLHALKLFPNIKELTESMGAYRAAKKYLWSRFRPSDETVRCVVVGDGGRPRTAALFAFRTKWTCYSVDPALPKVTGPAKVDRLHVVPRRIEDFGLYWWAETWNLDVPVVIVAVHSHASLDAAVRVITGSKRAVIAIPCCVKQRIDVGGGKFLEPDVTYDDWGIHAHQRTVRIWLNV